MKRLFVTGTNTGAGKTFVTAALARQARAKGKKVFAFKPIETGCERVGNELLGPDQEVISAAAGNWQTGQLRGVYRLVHPLAPLVAAQAEGKTIDLELIVKMADSVADVDLLLVEGAGGWRVPITESTDMSGLASRLQADVVLVARAGIGTINNTLLSVEAIERDGSKLHAVVMSRRPDEDLDFAQSNRAQIHRKWPGRIVMFDVNPTVLDPLITD